MFFSKKVDRRSKNAMVDFLASHFRYHTMNSWNAATSYANCIKVYRVGLSQEQMNRAWEVLDAPYWNLIGYAMDEVTQETGGRYTIGCNGRSGGYLVLYGSEYYEPDRTSACGGNERVSAPSPRRGLRVSMAGIDHGLRPNDLMQLSIGDLRDKVDLVCRVDRACDDVRRDFVDLIDRCRVVEETVMVPRTVRRIACAEA